MSSSSTSLGRPRVRIEHRWLRRSDRLRPLIVFLHEGLGSVAMWRDFPARLCDALGCRGLVYSRPGYGRSTPRAAEEAWGLDFMHRQAHEVLPALLQALGVDPAGEPWLFGHSDGGSIALLYAARFPPLPARWCWRRTSWSRTCRWPASRRRARPTATPTCANACEIPRRPRLGVLGLEPHLAAPAVPHWSIEDEIGTIRCPLLAVQGLDDEYGTLEQIRGIARACR
jgi:pimeloyl-ACP methyl ester carboxylesterase